MILYSYPMTDPWDGSRHISLHEWLIFMVFMYRSNIPVPWTVWVTIPTSQEFLRNMVWLGTNFLKCGIFLVMTPLTTFYRAILLLPVPWLYSTIHKSSVKLMLTSRAIWNLTKYQTNQEYNDPCHPCMVSLIHIFMVNVGQIPYIDGMGKRKYRLGSSSTK